jgi:serine protease Do
MHAAGRIAVMAVVFWPGLAAWGQEGDEAGRVRRETDVVRAIRAEKDAVVNVNTTVVMKSAFDDEDIFHFFPDIFGPPRPAQSLGSGFIIHKDGYIITNAHVVQRAKEVTVSFADKTTAKARAVYSDSEHDLAVIKIDTKGRNLHALPLGRGDDLMIGETVIAIGNPLGYQHSVSAGIISATDRTLEFRGGQTYRNLIQTDASINPGNSGGPLLNINGELIGINTAIRGDAQNIGFAINVDNLKQILPDLLSPETLRRANLGFRLRTRNNSVQVVSIDENSPAQRAGLRAGDMIVGYAGKKYINPIDFYVKLFEHPVGRQLSLSVQREGGLVTVDMPYEVKPKPDGKALARRRLGLGLKEVSSAEVQELGLSGDSALVVEHVVADSPAAASPIRRGDIIVQLDRYRIGSLDEVGQILETVRRGQPITAMVLRLRGGMYQMGQVTLKAR